MGALRAAGQGGRARPDSAETAMLAGESHGHRPRLRLALNRLMAGFARDSLRLTLAFAAVLPPFAPSCLAGLRWHPP